MTTEFESVKNMNVNLNDEKENYFEEIWFLKNEYKFLLKKNNVLFLETKQKWKMWPLQMKSFTQRVRSLMISLVSVSPLETKNA